MVPTQALLAEGKLDPAHEHLVRARQQSLSNEEKTTAFTTLGKVRVRQVWVRWGAPRLAADRGDEAFMPCMILSSVDCDRPRAFRQSIRAFRGGFGARPRPPTGDAGYGKLNLARILSIFLSILPTNSRSMQIDHQPKPCLKAPVGSPHLA